MNENYSSSLIKQNESELKKVEAIKTLAELIKKYAGAGALSKDSNNSKSSC